MNNVFIDSLRPPILRCSFKHTDRTCVFHFITLRLRERYIADIQEAPRKRTIERARFGLNCYQNYYRLVFLFAFLFSAEQFQDFLHNLFLLFFPMMYVHGCNICCVFCVCNICSSNLPFILIIF